MVEVAITMLLLAGAGTLVAHVRSVMAVDTGVRGERAIAIELTPAGDKYGSRDARRAFFADSRTPFETCQVWRLRASAINCLGAPPP